MIDYVKQLQTILTQSDLTPQEVKQGIILTYVIITCLNQTQGNPDVGLKQDADGLFSHINGFMGAIFWERGYDFDNPTLDQLVEVKIMMDGMTQIYAMPEDLQNALNDVYGMLVNRAKGMGGDLSAETKKILQIGDIGSASDSSGFFDEQAGSESESEPETEPVSEAASDDVESIISELPSEMESELDMALLSEYPGAGAVEASAEPAMSNESQVPSEPEFDPAKVLEDEAPVENVGSEDVAAEGSAEPEFDPADILESEPPSLSEDNAPVMSETDSMTTETSRETESEPESMSAWNSAVLSHAVETVDLTPPPTREISAETAPTPQAKPRKRSKRNKKDTENSVQASGEETKPRRRGRKRAGAKDGTTEKPKRKRNIKAKKLTIDLSAIQVPDDYMAEDSAGVEDSQGALTMTDTESQPSGSNIPAVEMSEGELQMETESQPEAGSVKIPSKPEETWSEPAVSETVESDAARTEEFTPVRESGAGEAISGMEDEPPAVESEQETGEIQSVLSDLSEVEGPISPSDDEESRNLQPDIEASEVTLAFGEQSGPESESTGEESEETLPLRETKPDQAEEYGEKDFSTLPLEEAATEQSVDIESDRSGESGESEEMLFNRDETQDELATSQEPSFAERLEQGPVPESSPSSWTEFQTEPAGGSPDRPLQSFSESESDSLSEESGAEPVTRAAETAPAPEEPIRKKGRFWMRVLVLLLGVVLGGGVSYYWFGIERAQQMKNKIQELEKQLAQSKEAQETAQSNLAQAREEAKKLSEVLNQHLAASKKPLEKPKYIKIQKGVLIYWLDKSPLRRKYYLYRAKGKKASLKKISDKPMSKNIMWLKKVSSGTWRYAVSAVDLEGNETTKSEELKLKFPLRR